MWATKTNPPKLLVTQRTTVIIFSKNADAWKINNARVLIAYTITNSKKKKNVRLNKG